MTQTKKQSMNRRDFLIQSAATIGGLSLPSFYTLPSFGQTAPKHLVFIFARGGMDALSLLPPAGIQATALQSFRPSLYVQSPLPFTSALNAHPALAPLLNDSGIRSSLNFILHAGSPNETRSHFEQMHMMETGNVADALSSTGFLANAGQLLQRKSFGISTSLPRSLRPAANATLFPLTLTEPEKVGAQYSPTGWKPKHSRAQRLGLFMKQSTEVGDALVDKHARMAYNEFTSLATQFGSLTMANLLSSPHGYLSSNFGKRLAMTGALLSTTSNPAFIAVDADHSWDTHHAQATNSPTEWGSLWGKIDDLAKNLVAFKKDLVARGKWASTAIVVVSEFGRTVRENGSKGTDHGRGGVMMLMGGPIRPLTDSLYLGPRSWSLPTTADSSTALAMNVDYRLVVAEILQRHIGMPSTSVASLFKPAISGNFLSVVK